MSVNATPCKDVNGTDLPWAIQLNDPDHAAACIASGQRFQEEISYRTGMEFFRKDITLAHEAVRQLSQNGTLKSENPIPVVWPPDGGVLTQIGIKQAFSEAGQPFKIFPCDGYQMHRKNHQRIPSEAMQMARKCGKLVIADGIIKDGETVRHLINSVDRDFKGEVTVLVNRVYQDFAFGRSGGDFFIDFMEEKHFPPAQKRPFKVNLYTALCGKGSEIDFVDVGNWVLGTLNRLRSSKETAPESDSALLAELEAGLLKRKDKLIGSDRRQL